MQKNSGANARGSPKNKSNYGDFAIIKTKKHIKIRFQQLTQPGQIKRFLFISNYTLAWLSWLLKPKHIAQGGIKMLDTISDFEKNRRELAICLASVLKSSKLLQQKRKKHQSHLVELDKTIAHLKQQLNGGVK